MNLLPISAAAGGGSVDGLPGTQLVAAGFTLLQRSPPLVRALSGTRGGILIPSSPAFLVALAACDGRGAVLINPLAAQAEIGYQIKDANIGAIFTVKSLADKVPVGTVRVLLDDAPRSATLLHTDGTSTSIDLGAHFGLEMETDTEVPGREEECAVVYTSAMSGKPLGAILTHRNLLANARQTVQAAEFSGDDHVLAVLPFAHLFGLTVSCMAPLIAGARVTTLPRFNPVVALDLVEREAITALVGVPAIFNAMLTAMERRAAGAPLKTESLRVCICGGAPLSERLQERWFNATGCELRQGYGLTEASPVALFNTLSITNRRGTLGVPFPGVKVEIRDPESGAPLPVGTEGEITIQGETVFSGYVSGEAQGLKVRGGWLHTGDRGMAHPDGSIEFKGLYKPMFTRNGFNVYPREVERIIGEMPGVTGVTCRGLADPATGNEVAVEVSGEVSEDDIKKWCEQNLASYKRPSRIGIRR